MTRPRELVHPSSFDWLNGLRGEHQIHRYCSIKELYDILRGKLTLTCPFRWEDPFENPLFRAKFIKSDGEEVPLREAGQKLYCQSWTLEEESDAMWKLYGSKSEGICITVYARDLYFHAYNSYDIEENEAVYTKIGKVEYLDETEVRKKFEAEDEFVESFLKSNCEGYYQSLLIKRKAYSYENEVRLIVHDFDGRFGCKETMRLTILVDGVDWIESVTFGPAVDTDTFKAHREQLLKLGLTEEKIKISTLYGSLQYTIYISR